MVYILIWPIMGLWAGMVIETAVLDAMWISLNTGRPGYSVLKALQVFRVTGPFTLVVFFGFRSLQKVGGAAVGFTYGTVLEVVLVIVLLLIPLLTLSFSKEPQKRLRQIKDEFRRTVRQSLPEVHDPRLAKWDPRKRFPWP